MKERSKIKTALYIIIPIVLMALIVLRLKTNKEITQQKVYRYDKEKPVMVETDTIRLALINEAGTYTGTFEPNKETKISADIQGKVNSILVDVGSYVTEGQTLIQLDHSLLKLQLQAVEVQIEGLQNDVNRYTILTKADAVQGVQLEKAQLGLKAAKVQKASLWAQIGKTAIKAPFSGIVTAKLTEEGGFAAPGIPLLQITNIASLRFTVNVAETDLVHFQNNQPYPVSADAYPAIKLAGRVILIGSKANMGNSFPVQLQVANTQDLLIKSGMFGKVSISASKPEQGIAIPASAIIEKDGKTQVYVIKNGKALLQTIAASKNVTNKIIVSKGLNEGDVIVTNGFINLFNNAPVVVK